MEDKLLIEDFYRKWGNFPGVARLIQKNRIILATNEAAKKAGFGVDIQCVKVGSPESHMGCLANKTLTTKTGQGDCIEGNLVRYWLPVDGRDDVYVHFSVSLGNRNESRKSSAMITIFSCCPV